MVSLVVAIAAAHVAVVSSKDGIVKMNKREWNVGRRRLFRRITVVRVAVAIAATERERREEVVSRRH